MKIKSIGERSRKNLEQGTSLSEDMLTFENCQTRIFDFVYQVSRKFLPFKV